MSKGLDDLIEALTIFRKYGNPQSPTHCEHDTLYVNIPFNKVNKEDIIKLHDLGFFENTKDVGFMSYRYGSA